MARPPGIPRVFWLWLWDCGGACAVTRSPEASSGSAGLLPGDISEWLQVAAAMLWRGKMKRGSGSKDVPCPGGELAWGRISGQLMRGPGATFPPAHQGHRRRVISGPEMRPG
ncbi:hypothetical protein NDU88_000895 [Pleurodeles waltl]|uniref:Secreted protein n=1 Tax=Pleurodeles waltl TaxID=8319 RepID=A0AAV7U5I9_PLEWA|nr:hypothetical protein NDU88_000895 [Pleurodeles waltl]